ncbi:restriction endonuclease subunit S [Enterococcus hirae]
MSNDTQPEIRFPGFTEAWEERKLGELGKTQSGIGFPDAEQGGSEGIPFFKVSDMNNIGNEYEMRNANHYVSNEQIERKKWKPIEDVPAIIFAKVGAAIMLNRKRLVTSPFLIDNNTMAYLFNNTWDIYFGKILFETINLPRYSQVGALPSYNSSDIENISVKVPVKDEQQKIGNFFKQLDDTIVLHQRKLDLLKETKKGFLQKMFPKNGAKVPEIRFPGFTGDWEQRKLGDIFKKDTQKNKDLEFNSDSVISVAKMKLSTPSAKSSDEYMKTYNKIWKGNIAFEGHTNDEFPNGRFVLNDCQDGIVSHIYDVYSAVDEYDNEFMKRYINNPYVMRKILINATSSARMMKSLNSVEFLKQSILLPILSEQQKIGGFFYQLDNIIALHQRKLDLLKETKKGFLQKMFV